MTRKIEPEELRKALEMYCVGTGKTFSEGEDGGQKRYLLSPGDEAVQLVDGQITTKSQILYEKLCELIMDMRMVQDEPAKASKPATSVVPRANIPSPQKKPVFGAMAKAPTGGLSAQDVINYINPKATEQEAVLFAEFCRRKGADPMTKDVYLIIYEGPNGRQCNFIAGKEYFMRKAEEHPQFKGHEAGIIVASKNQESHIERREGTFWQPDREVLLGGWAMVYRADRDYPIMAEVPLADFDTKKNLWLRMPATMIRKVALVQALREAFPASLGGMYDSAEISEEKP